MRVAWGVAFGPSCSDCTTVSDGLGKPNWLQALFTRKMLFICLISECWYEAWVRHGESLIYEATLSTMYTTWMLWLLALISGALIPVQAAANAALSKAINGNVPFSALTLFAVAGITTALGTLLTGREVPNGAAFAAAPWWSYIGGLIVAFYVFTITFLAPRLGVGSAVSLIVTVR